MAGTKGQTLIIVAAGLLLGVLILSRMFPLYQEGFQATNNKQLCDILKKGQSDVKGQMDEAKTAIGTATDQLKKIEESVKSLQDLSVSFGC